MRQQSAAWDNLGLSLSSARNGENQLPHCHTGTIDAAWIAVKDLIPNSLCSKSKDLLPMWSAGSGDMWICIPISSKKQFQRWSACSEKKEKTCQHVPMKWIQNPHETQILPNYRARIWHNSACRNVFSLWRKCDFLEKHCFYEHGSWSAGMFMYNYSCDLLPRVPIPRLCGRWCHQQGSSLVARTEELGSFRPDSTACRSCRCPSIDCSNMFKYIWNTWTLKRWEGKAFVWETL